MRTNPFYDAWLFLTGSTGDHEASGVGWLLTALYLALLIASIAIAYSNWRQDASQRTMGHLATWFMRVMIGTMWYQGSIWKLPLPVAGGLQASNHSDEPVCRVRFFQVDRGQYLPAHSPRFLIFVQGFFVVTNAGRSLGLDAVITRKPFGLFAGVASENSIP
jgi:hypothetical protein